jgi:ABC-type nitrate/sulfonate/bicarbonate transport system substrate-binding protein
MVNQKRLRIIGGVVCCAIGIGLLGAPSCRRHETVGEDKSRLEKVSVRMKWFFAGTMTGWFTGKEKGVFQDQGINLEIMPGGPDNSSIKLVAAGSDQFGVAGADEVLIARAKGIPVVAIGVLFKDSPVCFISKKEKGIASPQQWGGKTIEVDHGSNAEVQYRALVKKFAIQGIHEVPYTFSLAPFIENKVDVSVAYRMDQVVTLQRRGLNIDIVTPKDYGINPYGDVVITTESILKNRPDLPRKFMQATAKSFRWAIEHPDESVNALVKSVPTLKHENESAVWAATIPFLTVDGGLEKIGVMSPNRWQETTNSLIEFDFLKSPFDPSQAYKNVLDE